MIEARLIEPFKVTYIDFPKLYAYIVKEYNNLSSIYDQIKQSPLNNDLYQLEDVYFVVDGFEGAPLSQQLTSKLEIFLAVKRQDGLEIHRGLKFNMSPISLFYTSAQIHRTIKDRRLFSFTKFGIIYTERERLIYKLSSISNRIVFHFLKPEEEMTFELEDNIDIVEDFGEAIYEFPKGYKLGKKKIAEKLLSVSYGIAGANHYSTTPVKDGTLCVLMVENDNQYDDHAILILRWVPVLKSEIGNAYVHPLYKMAHISRSDNHELYEEMIKTGNHILFGTVVHGRISILGNAKALDSQSLNDYILPFSLFNLLK